MATKKNAAPVVKAAKAAVTALPVRRVDKIIQATMEGQSNVRPTSIRGRVLAAIQGAPKRKVLLSELDRQFQGSTSGHIQKLLVMSHVKFVAK